jgi:Tol biopolymer transport system component
MTRIPDPGFDLRVADWLEADPVIAPADLLRTVESALPSIPQRRVVRLPWRLPPMNRFALIAATVGLLALAGLGLLTAGGRPTPPPTPVPTAAAAVATPTPTPRSDYSDLGGRILMEHLGNAPDGSEMPTTDYHPERRRLYFVDPSTMTGAAAIELLPGEPAAGKLNADVSDDGTRVVFMDTDDPAKVWIVGIDGTGLRQLSTECGCSELDPAFDATGTKIAFVHVEGASRASKFGANQGYDWDGRTPVTSWIGIRDLATGKVTKVDATTRTGADGLPYQPAWSPDGTRIAFSRITWATGGSPTATLHVVDIATDTVTDLPVSDSTPGDPDWSPDGTRLLYTNYPWSSMGSIGGLPPSTVLTVLPDGTDRQTVASGSGASYMPDGRVVYMNNYFYVANADGTENHPVNDLGDDLSELAVGFAYIPHWVGEP